MKHILGVALVVLTLLSADCARAGPAPASPPAVKLALDVVDGSRIVGAPAAKEIKFQTDSARLNLAWSLVQTVAFGTPQHQTVITLANGDRLTGTLADKGLELKTAFGAVKVPVAGIQRVTCSKGTAIEEEEIVQDRGAFIPKHHYPALKGTVVGVLVGNALDAITVQEGGGGSPEALVFSAAGSCYRWVYVPVMHNPGINTLDVQVGEKGDAKKVFTSLDMANAKTTKPWGVQGPYVLVELEVNDNLGAPRCEENQGFVATKMRPLDGTQEFPLKVADVVTGLRQRYQQYLADQEQTIATALTEAGRDALKGAIPTGPRQREETMFVTWLPDKECLVVRFRTTLTDGAYKIAGNNIHHETGRRGSRVGIAFGIEFGQGYEVSKTGETTRVLELPVQSFTKRVGYL